METFHFPQFPGPFSAAHTALYTDVKNAAQLRKRIIDAAGAEGVQGDQEREAVNFAFIDARYITSRLHLQTAIYQAILAQSQNALRTRTVHSEILWALNPTNNISEAIRRYGISDATTALFVVRIDEPTLDIQQAMNEVVSGTIGSFALLEKITDWSSIKKYHKLNDGTPIRNDIEYIDNIVISTVAAKSVIS